MCAGFTGDGDRAGKYGILSTLDAPCFNMATAVPIFSASVVLIHLCFAFSLSTIKKPLVTHIGYKLVIFLIFCKCLSYIILLNTAVHKKL